jgi:Protein of unknown function (DUF3179)
MKRDILFIVLIAGLLIFGGIIIWKQVTYVSPDVFKKPTAMELGGRGQSNVVTYPASNATSTENVIETEEEIFITDGIKHMIPLEKVVSGGPPKDGIPAISEPKFETVNQADQYLRNDGLGVGIDDGENERFYPFQILVWHEIVNDTIGGMPVAVTYCPLCGTAVAYESVVNNQPAIFGVSGKLYDSNLLMYDQATDSYWSQALGKAVVGELTGVILPLYQHFENVSWGEWKKAHPDGEVLSRETGFVRDYTREPYENYAETSGLFFPVSNDDSRLPRKELIVGLVVDGAAKAYQVALFADVDEIEDVINGEDILLTKKDDEGIRGYRFTDEGDKVRVPLNFSFWFSWAASYPTTLIYK